MFTLFVFSLCLALALHSSGSPAPGLHNKLRVPRQSSGASILFDTPLSSLPTQCQASCTPVDNCPLSDTCCDQDNAAISADCLNCLVAIGNSDKQDAQNSFDQYQSSCVADGFTVADATIDGTSSGGSASSSSGGGSSSASSGGGSASTSSSGGSVSSSGGGSASTSGSGGSVSTSGSGGSVSSSGDGSASSSSGGGAGANGSDDGAGSTTTSDKAASTQSPSGKGNGARRTTGPVGMLAMAGLALGVLL
ncbi:hypothetical protein GGX14DRAFT_407190 [Mycena pura]|uniref:Extracellular membrane protein CFEM domain-containing protein n=1 Tax=Mycena pura TaxID=153505 RepID=A0AAD6UNT9_9AGAR|nr:hypothetical protein GGX14DRAFT_407190 [Mycena pura]